MVINSYAFTLLVAPADGEERLGEFERLAAAVRAANPWAEPIPVAPTLVTVVAGGDHVAANFRFTADNYPNRFYDTPEPHTVAALKDELKAVVLYVPKDLVEAGDAEPIADGLQRMVDTRERATAYRQRVAVWTDGYDTDPRPLCEIPEPREFFRRLFDQCPFALFLAHPRYGLFEVLATCWVRATLQPGEPEGRGIAAFLDLAFAGLNLLAHRLAFSDDLVREVSMSATRLMDGEP